MILLAIRRDLRDRDRERRVEGGADGQDHRDVQRDSPRKKVDISRKFKRKAEKF